MPQTKQSKAVTFATLVKSVTTLRHAKFAGKGDPITNYGARISPSNGTNEAQYPHSQQDPGLASLQLRDEDVDPLSDSFYKPDSDPTRNADPSYP